MSFTSYDAATVTALVAGTGVTLSPAGGTGTVTINAAGINPALAVD